MRKLLYWATSYGLSGSDLYAGWNWRKYLRQNEIVYKDTVTWLCGRVLKYCLYLAMKDIIDNKTTFRFPPRSGATLQMVATYGDDFIRARKNGAFQDVDFLASNFTAYTLQLQIKNRYNVWNKRVYLTSKYRDKIVELTNKGCSW